MSIEDENLILETINVQRGWWLALIVMDTLVVALFTGMMVHEELPNNGHWSETARNRLIFAYNTNLALSLYFCIYHLMVVLLLFALSSYMFKVKGIMFFFVECHSLLVTVNFGGMILLVPGVILSPLFGQLITQGLALATPSIIFTIFAFSFNAYVYLKVIKPVFKGLFNAQYANASLARISKHIDVDFKTEPSTDKDDMA